MEPTSVRAESLLAVCKKMKLSRYKAAMFITAGLSDKNDRVQMNAKDLSGLILNIAKEFDEISR